jgi:hypothetical protein
MKRRMRLLSSFTATARDANISPLAQDAGPMLPSTALRDAPYGYGVFSLDGFSLDGLAADIARAVEY